MLLSSSVVYGNIDDVAYLDEEPSTSSSTISIPSGSLLTVRGWASLRDDPGASVAIFAMLDDGPAIEIVRGIERRDVAAAMGDESYAMAGFRGILSTSHLSLGDHRVRVAIRSGDGTLLNVGEPVSFAIVETIEQRLIAPSGANVSTPMAVDEVTIGFGSSPIAVVATQDDTLHLRGWAIDGAEGALASGVYAVIGSTVIRADYGATRPDVASHYRNERLSDCGFTIEIPLDRFSAGPHTIRLRVAGAGEHVIYEGPRIAIEIAPFAAVGAAAPGGLPTLGSIDKLVVFDALGNIIDPPAPMTLVRGNQLFISGWAIDEPGDSLARMVQVCIDGRVSTTAVYGLERRDVAQHFHRPDLAECGFVALVATASIPPGRHIAVLRVLDRGGIRYYDLAQQVDFSVVEV